MNVPVELRIDDPKLAQNLSGQLSAGRHFVFVQGSADGPTSRQGKRRRRLLLDEAESPIRVYPLGDEPVQLPGVTISSSAVQPEPLAAVVADRDLYRAEEDDAHLLVVLPEAPGNVRLVVECDGQAFSERDLQLENGAALVVLSALMAGYYWVSLEVAGRRLAASAEFTVAEYALAPLSASLLNHQIQGERDRLAFELAVESWQQPSTEALLVGLMDQGREVDRVTLNASAPGHYAGTLGLSGEGPFSLEIAVDGDPGRVARVAIPGSREVERELTVISELGKEVVFSLLPEPNTIPVRGGYLAEQDYLSTPFTVDAVLTHTPSLTVRTDADEIHLIVFDLVAGSQRVIKHGPASAGDVIAVDNPSGLALVALGAVVNGEPFEAFTTFLSPGQVALDLQAPAQARPRETLSIQLKTGLETPVPVLLTVRDRRLSATDTPASSLGAAFKRGVMAATSGMDHGGIEPLDLDPYEEVLFASLGEFDELSLAGGIPRSAAGVEFALYAEAAEESAAMDAPLPRQESPPLLFIALLQVTGSAQVQVWSGDATGTFVVEAFAYHGGDWQASTRDLLVDQPLRVDLELPPSARSGDDVRGRLRVASASGRGRVQLTRDGAAVALEGIGESAAHGALATPALLEFPVQPGRYLARVEDPDSGEVDQLEGVVREPGVLRSHARELILLSPGEAISLEDAGALSLRVLPGLEEPFDLLVEATADYTHLCCEQTAAKILSAVAMYLFAENPARRARAESIISKGISREQRMFRPGKGFRMYPGNAYVSQHYSKLAVRYLWGLAGLSELAGLSLGLRRAIAEGLKMADDAGRFHRLEKIPGKPTTLEDCYAALLHGGNRQAALGRIDDLVDFQGPVVGLRKPAHAVATRAGLAYAAAALLAAGDLSRGFRAANAVVSQFGETGRLYSTVDSVAAIALMMQLRLRNALSGSARLRVNGTEMDIVNAVSLSDGVESVECLAGTVAVQALALREERWETYGAAFPIRVGLRDARGRSVSHLHPGQRVDLLVHLDDGYRVGDLVHVDLPACLSWLRGGGLVKRFTVDFEGQNQLRIPLAVTGQAPGGQHLATCVRNMFEEERRANPGLMKVATTTA